VLCEALLCNPGLWLGAFWGRFAAWDREAEPRSQGKIDFMNIFLNALRAKEVKQRSVKSKRKRE